MSVLLQAAFSDTSVSGYPASLTNLGRVCRFRFAEQIRSLTDQVEQLCCELEIAKNASVEETARLRYVIEDKVRSRAFVTCCSFRERGVCFDMRRF